MPETPGRKLVLFRQNDPLKYWWSLGELRVCTKCEHLFTGHDIRLIEDHEGRILFHCPTHDCAGSWVDWEYPELHL
jgi:hypothetical protein